MSGGPSIAAKLANIQHMPVLIAATVASDKPTDGYLVKDIIKMSYESQQTRVFLQQYLLNMLITSSNVYVKIKVLKLLQLLVDEGHVEFKQNLRKQPEPINEAAKLKALHSKDGKMLSECNRIRDMANKLLDTMYSDTPELRKRPAEPEYGLLDEGQSSDSGSRIRGFGNTPVKPKPPSAGDKLKALFGTSGKSPSNTVTYDPSYATLDPVPHNTGTNTPFTPQINSYSSGRYLEGPAPSGAPHERGRAGGGWDDGKEFRSAYQRPSSSNPKPLSLSRGQEPSETDAEQLEQTQTEQERRLVDDITAPGGVRAAPPRERLTTFITRCKSLDCLAVVECLRVKLQNEESQVVLRTLFVLEALLRSDVPDILSFLDLTLDELNALTSSTHSSIKAKATKILRQLTAEGTQRQAISSRAAPPDTRTETGKILDLGTGSTNDEKGLQQVAEMAPEENSELLGLFSGMSLTGASGKKTTPPVKRVQPVEPVKQVQPEAPKNEVQETTTSSDSFAALLGMDDSFADQQGGEPCLIQEDDSLVDFGGDEEEFDPLKRSNSLIRSGSFGGQGGSLATQQRKTVNRDIMSQLSGLDLSATSESGSSSGILQPMQTTSAQNLSMPPTFQGAPLSQMVPAGGAGVVYATPTGHPMYGMVPGGAATTGGMVPVLYAPHAPGVMYMQQPAPAMAGMLGGNARPVQRPKEQSPPANSSFGFLSKSNKSSAFDFVQEEMKASQLKAK